MDLKIDSPFIDHVAHNNLSSLNWSAEMGAFIEESSKNHFIDIYNRDLVFYYLKDILVRHQAEFIDVGCASGYLLEEIKKKYPQLSLIGGDYEVSSLLQAYARVPEVPLARIDITQLPYKDTSFDGISCLNVLEHVKEDVAALLELRRVLKKNGRVLITVPAGEHLVDLYDEVHFHVRRYSRKSLIEKIEKSGFKIEKINYFACFLYPPFYCVKRFNQLRYRQYSFEQKKALAQKLSKSHNQSNVMNWFCSLEEKIGSVIPFPFGVRLFALLKK